MINEKDIESRVAELLNANGFNAVAGEVKEGFKKPAVFISVYPAYIELLNADMEQVTDAVEIRYISSVETVEDCADAAQRLRTIFMYKPLVVKDRRLTIQAIEFNIENYVLYAFFDVEYMQATPTEDEYEKIEELKLGGNVNGFTDN